MDGKIKELFEKITKYIRPPFRSNDVTDEILEKTGGRGLYAKHEIDLSIANSDTDISISGDNLTVEDCPDAVTVKLNHKKNPEIDLQKIPEVEGPFKHLFINNAAGSGTLKFFTGDKGMFRAKKKLEIINTAEYIIYKDGSNIICIDGHTGNKVKQGTNAATVIQYALDNTTNGKIVLKKGKYVIDTKLSIVNHGVEFCSTTMARRNTGGVEVASIWMDDNVDDSMLYVSGFNCHLHDFILYGNKANQASGHGIETVSNTSLDLHLDNVYIVYVKQNGVHLKGGQCSMYAVYVEYCDGAGYNLIDNAVGNKFIRCGSYFDKYGWNINRNENTFIGCVAADSIEHGFIFETAVARDCIMLGCTVLRSGHHGIWIYGGQKNIISNCSIKDVSNDHDDTYDGINLSTVGAAHTNHNIISNNYIRSTVANKHKYGIRETDANQDYNMISNNIISDSVTASILPNGANSIIKDNIGWINENGGAAANIADGGTIAHGLVATPTYVSVVGSVAGEMVQVTGLGAANITVAIKTHAGAAGTQQTIYWRAWI